MDLKKHYMVHYNLFLISLLCSVEYYGFIWCIYCLNTSVVLFTLVTFLQINSFLESNGFLHFVDHVDCHIYSRPVFVGLCHDIGQ